MKYLIKTLGLCLNLVNLFSSNLAGKLTFKVFCSPFAAKLTAKQQQYLDEAIAHTITVNNEKVKYYQWGQGPKKVLMIHGWRSNAYRWKLYINALPQEEYTIYALDFPAHGASEGKYWNVLKGADCIKAISDKIGHADIMMGHSVGAFAMLYAIDHMLDVMPKGIVLLAPARKLMDFIRTVQSMLGLSEKTLKSMIDYGENLLGQKVEAFSIYNCTSKIDFPSLLVHDEADPDTTVETSKQLHKLIANSELMLTQGLGHKLRDRKVLSRVTSFIKGI